MSNAVRHCFAALVFFTRLGHPHSNTIALRVRGKEVFEVRHIFTFAMDLLFELFSELRHVEFHEYALSIEYASDLVLK